MSRTALVVLVLLAAGCASAPPRPYPEDPAERLATYARSQGCCSDPSQFTYRQLPASGSIDVVIGAADPVFEFHSGLSPFVAFRLPDTDAAYRVRVKSLFDGPSDAGGSVFYPVLAMMDESFIVTRVSNLENLRLEQALAVPGGESGLAVTAPFDPDAAPERFLVVFTPGLLLGAPPDERREGDVLTGPTMEWLDRRGDGVVEPSPYGRLSVSVAPVAPPGPG